MIEVLIPLLSSLHEHSSDMVPIILSIGVVLMWKMNVKLAVIIEKVESHEKRLDKLEVNE